MTKTQEDNKEIGADDKELNKNNVPGKFKRGLAFVVVSVLVIGAVAVLLYRGYGNTVGESKRFMEQFNSQISLLQERTAVLEGRLDALTRENASLLETLEGVANRPLPTNSVLAINEVEHLLIIASQRINIDRNVATALAAMQEAEKRLVSLHEPGLGEVRKQLVEDTKALRSVNEVDVSGLALYLADMAKRVDMLRLKNTAGDFDAAEEGSDLAEKQDSIAIIELIRQKVAKMVSIKRRSAAMKVLPDEQYYIYQSLKIELLNARQAVLNKDTANMRESIMLALGLLEQYFDGTQPVAGNLIASLSKMETLDLQPPIPDITSSLETLRAYIRYEDLPDVSGDVPGTAQ